MNVSRGARRLLDLLKWYRSKFPKIYVSLTKLASQLDCCVRTVKRWIAELKAEKLISVAHHGPRGAVFSVPDVPDSVPDSVPDRSPHLLLSSRSKTVRSGYRPFLPERKPAAYSEELHSPAAMAEFERKLAEDLARAI